MKVSDLHPLLRRQLRRALETPDLDGLECADLLQAMPSLLDKVSATYAAAEDDREILEHSLDETSAELVAHTRRLRSDIERLHALQAELRDKQRRLDFQRERMPLGLIEWDAKWKVTDWNPAAEALFGWSRDEMIGHSTTERIVPPHARDTTATVVASLLDGAGGLRSINGNVRRDGTMIRCEWFNTTLFDDAGEVIGVAALVRDVTERMKWEEQLLHASWNDELTSLPNRRFFVDDVDRALARSRQHAPERFALLFLDIDRFKDVNDSRGHSVGNALLRAIATRLAGLVGDSDLVARIGGDEFAVRLDGIDDGDAAVRAAERIGDAMQRPFELEDHHVRTSVSIGVTLSSECLGSAEQMLRDADIAMYRAKVAGRARTTLFDAAMYEEALERIELEGDLRQALQRGELRLVYQPIVDLVSGALVGLEALLRWRHATRGPIMPEVFIPLAEETSAILPIGRWVMDRAIQQVSAWGSVLPEDCYVSVNISPLQLLQPGLPQVVDAALTRHGVPASRLCVEITESSMLGGEHTHQSLEQLHDRGVRIFMDDFGTGYASLANLAAFQIDALKIDRTFVRRANGRDSGFLQAILLLAHALGKTTIAEGIEEPEELELARSLGADFGQGYLLSRPLEAQEVAAWIREHPPRSPERPGPEATQDKR
ncbi:MAG: diguanylate cyclase (GGDEF)-like protein/PAS domain S-box-containing protein [Myxococcota bacterium]